MTRNLSIYLDLLRLGAAFLVFLGHAGEIFALRLPDILIHTSKEGVAAFFVLSGFVIAYVSSGKERTWRDYAGARLVRLYSVVPLAVAVLLACYAIGHHMAPLAYAPSLDATGETRGHLYGVTPAVPEVLRYLTFTNEIWFDRAVIVTGSPFWSLAFEAAYYVAFGIAFFGRGHWRWIGAGLWLLACGPRIAVALPLWLIGFGAYHLMVRVRRLPQARATVLLVVTIIVAIALRRVGGIYAVPLFAWPPIPQLALSLAYYGALSLVVAASIVLFAWATADREVWPLPVASAIRYFAGASFTLYLVHIPLLTLILALAPGAADSRAGVATAILITLLAVLALAELGERRKNTYRRALGIIPNIFRKSTVTQSISTS